MYIESYIYLGIGYFQITYEQKKKKKESKESKREEIKRKIEKKNPKLTVMKMQSIKNFIMQLTQGLEH